MWSKGFYGSWKRERSKTPTVEGKTPFKPFLRSNSTSLLTSLWTDSSECWAVVLRWGDGDQEAQRVIPVILSSWAWMALSFWRSCPQALQVRSIIKTDFIFPNAGSDTIEFQRFVSRWVAVSRLLPIWRLSIECSCGLSTTARMFLMEISSNLEELLYPVLNWKERSCTMNSARRIKDEAGSG